MESDKDIVADIQSQLGEITKRWHDDPRNKRSDLCLDPGAALLGRCLVEICLLRDEAGKSTPEEKALLGLAKAVVSLGPKLENLSATVEAWS